MGNIKLTKEDLVNYARILEVEDFTEELAMSIIEHRLLDKVSFEWMQFIGLLVMGKMRQTVEGGWAYLELMVSEGKMEVGIATPKEYDYIKVEEPKMGFDINPTMVNYVLEYYIRHIASQLASYGGEWFIPKYSRRHNLIFGEDRVMGEDILKSLGTYNHVTYMYLKEQGLDVGTSKGYVSEVITYIIKRYTQRMAELNKPEDIEIIRSIKHFITYRY